MQDEENNKLRVIVCRPGEVAAVAEIDDDLHAMQELVGGGLIQEFMPFTGADPRYDDVALICFTDIRFLLIRYLLSLQQPQCFS